MPYVWSNCGPVAGYESTGPFWYFQSSLIWLLSCASPTTSGCTISTRRFAKSLSSVPSSKSYTLSGSIVQLRDVAGLSMVAHRSSLTAWLFLVALHATTRLRRSGNTSPYEHELHCCGTHLYSSWVCLWVMGGGAGVSYGGWRCRGFLFSAVNTECNAVCTAVAVHRAINPHMHTYTQSQEQNKTAAQ